MGNVSESESETTSLIGPYKLVKMDWHEIKGEALDEPETPAEHSSVVMAADVYPWRRVLLSWISIALVLS